MRQRISEIAAPVRTKLLPALAAAGCSWLCMFPFLEDHLLRAVLLFPSSLMLLKIFFLWQKGKKTTFAREQYKWLLEHLLARVSAGASLERATSDAADSLSPMLGRQSTLAAALRQVKNKLRSGQNLHDLFSRLGKTIPCPEARVFFPALIAVRNSGGQIDQFIRQQLQQVIEQLNIQKDVDSENTQRRTEAFILCLLPFLLALVLRDTLQSARQTDSRFLIQITCAAAYLLSMAALYLTLTGLVPGSSPRIYIPFSQAAAKRLPFLNSAGRTVEKIYRHYLPASFSSRIFRQLRAEAEAENLSSEYITSLYFNRKISLMLYACLPMAIMAASFPAQPYWLLFPPLMAVLQDQRFFSQATRQMILYRLEMPWLLNTVSSLLLAGLSLHKSLDVCSFVLSGLKEDSREYFQVITNDIRRVRNFLATAWPGSRIAEELAADCPVPEAQAALLLMSRYEKSGGSELLQMVQLQCSACWVVQRGALRRKMELHSLLLLLPMTMDLLAILLVALLPALISLRMA